MENQEEKDNTLLKVITQLPNLVVGLLILVIALTILLYNYMPDYVPSKEVEVSVPDKNGNFTDAAKQDALGSIDTVNYWQAPDLATLEGDKNKDKILYGKDIIAHTAE